MKKGDSFSGPQCILCKILKKLTICWLVTVVRQPAFTSAVMCSASADCICSRSTVCDAKGVPTACRKNITYH